MIYMGVLLYILIGRYLPGVKLAVLSRLRPRTTQRGESEM